MLYSKTKWYLDSQNCRGRIPKGEPVEERARDLAATRAGVFVIGCGCFHGGEFMVRAPVEKNSFLAKG